MSNANVKTKLDSTTAEKDLGVVIDLNLEFDAHIISTVQKANKFSGLLMRNITHKSKDIILDTSII